MNGRLNIVIGIPGCGKSTYIEQHKGLEDYVVSSDAIREEYNLDPTKPKDNQKTFQVFHHRIRWALSKGLTVWADATSINMKARRSVIQCAKKDDEVYAYLMIAHPHECIERDAQRDRTVGEDVIWKFVKRFQMPILEEGFKDVIICYTGDTEEYIDLPEYEGWLYRESQEIKQDSKWHRETLLEHLSAARDLFAEMEEDEDALTVHAAFLHDCGKCFTQSKDHKGYHFFNHENVGAYDFLCWVRGDSITPADRYKVAKVINYHDHSYKYKPEKLRRIFGEEFAEFLELFHKVDVASSDRDEGVVDRPIGG